MPAKDPAKLVKISVSLPFGLGSAEWEVDPTERRAAWALYVELVTRIAVQPLGENEGIMREALNSLYTLFSTTRSILREYGPQVGSSKQSVGGIAITVLNSGLRPFLSYWHPKLQAWEELKKDGVPPQKHEKDWAEEPELRNSLELLRKELDIYSKALATIAGVE